VLKNAFFFGNEKNAQNSQLSLFTARMSGTLPRIRFSLSAEQGQHLVSILMGLTQIRSSTPPQSAILPGNLVIATVPHIDPAIFSLDSYAPMQQTQTKLQMEKMKMVEMNFTISNIYLGLYESRKANSIKELLIVSFAAASAGECTSVQFSASTFSTLVEHKQRRIQRS
jgi:hypothetical protein